MVCGGFLKKQCAYEIFLLLLFLKAPANVGVTLRLSLSYLNHHYHNQVIREN